MCRFLLVKSTKPIQPATILKSFAEMAKNSRALDGDWQGDGWGICSRADNSWKTYTSLLPVWQDTPAFSDFPATNMFLVHARSASFAKDKGHLEYNQPYTANSYAFVFNGLLKGVKFSTPLSGQIGAQKIRSLFLQNTADAPLYTALEKTIYQLRQHTQTVQALNIGVSDGEQFSVYCQYAAYPDYYGLKISKKREMTIVCSEPLPGITFHNLPVEKVITF